MTGYLYRGLPWLEEINAEIMAARTSTREARPDSSAPSCGTEAGYQRHRRYGERACDRCLRGASLRRRMRDEMKADREVRA